LVGHRGKKKKTEGILRGKKKITSSVSIHAPKRVWGHREQKSGAAIGGLGRGSKKVRRKNGLRGLRGKIRK